MEFMLHSKVEEIFHIFIMNFLWVIFILISSAWLTWATTNKQNEDSEDEKIDQN